MTEILKLRTSVTMTDTSGSVHDSLRRFVSTSRSANGVTGR